jgi:hypothetical protein
MPRNCVEENCNKRAWYNFNGELNTLYCGYHKKDGMQNIRVNRCKGDECNKYPSYNFEGLKAEYCLEHKEEGMFIVRGKLCQFENCKKRANYKHLDEKFPTHCFKHKGIDMVIHKKGKTCELITCEKIATYNFEGLNTRFCKDHKEDGMVNMRDKSCNFPDCNVTKGYNYKGQPAKFCLTHKLDGMVDVKNTFCEFENCDKQPSFNYEGLKQGRFCASHQLDGMVDTKNRKKKCLTEMCYTFVGNDKYKGYCLFCYIHMFPDEPVTRNYKTKESAVIDFVLSEFPNEKYSWVTDKKIAGGCSKKRPDILLDLGYQVIIVEIDENQHTDYDCFCENKRLMELSQDVGHRPIVFIRFNPDDYKRKDKKPITSCWGINKNGINRVKKSKKKEWQERLDNLKSQIEYWICDANVTNKTIEIVQLYFDE